MTPDTLETLLDAVPLPLVAIGGDERIRGLNGAARNLLGSGSSGRHYVLAMRQPALLDAIEGSLRHGQPVLVRITLTTAGSDSIWEVRVSPIILSDGPGVLCAFADVTAAEQIGQMRRDFVANVSHELRTPLTALLGFIETLRGPARDDAAARDRFLTIMEREAGRMARLVQDLLQLSRVEADERVRPTERVDVVALAQAALVTLRPAAEAAGVRLDLIGTGHPLRAIGDHDQITQVIQNLIENAMKYGAAGGRVELRLGRLDREASLRGPAVKIEVQDWGDGIDAIHLPRLTERFYRVDSHRSRAQGGTGLGLAIVKHVVNRHRGRFRIDSERGKGSTFTVLLPES